MDFYKNSFLEDGKMEWAKSKAKIIAFLFFNEAGLLIGALVY